MKYDAVTYHNCHFSLIERKNEKKVETKFIYQDHLMKTKRPV